MHGRIPAMLTERIVAFVRGESSESFEELALAVFRHEYETIAAFRELCDERRATPERVSDWRQVPAVSTSPDPGLGHDREAPEEAPDGDLRSIAIDHSFPAACLENMGRPPVLSLISPDDAARATGPEFLAARVLRDWAAPENLVAVATRGVEAAKARSFLGARQRDRQPTLVLATSETLAQLLEAFDRRGLRFRLPPGSRVVEAGARLPGSPELLARLADGLALPAEGLVREYGTGALASRFYAGHSRTGKARPFQPPPWARVRILDADTMAEVSPGTVGSISVFDLASACRVAHQLTGDLGTAGADSFRLVAGGVPPT